MNSSLVLIALLLCYFLFMSVPTHAAELPSNSSELHRPRPYSTMEEFELQRGQMVQFQLRDRGIEDRRVLSAMSQVPRHQFIDSSWKDLAYSDRPLPIGNSQTISQPYIRGLHERSC